MGFWIFMFLVSLLIPGCMLGFGWVFLNKPPKSINAAYGYRTMRSMKSQETWDFAHQYAGGLWFRWGKWLMIVSVVAMLLTLGRSEDVIGYVGAGLCMVQMVPLIAVIVPTEDALKRYFDKNGKRRRKKTDENNSQN